MYFALQTKILLVCLGLGEVIVRGIKRLCWLIVHHHFHVLISVQRHVLDALSAKLTSAWVMVRVHEVSLWIGVEVFIELTVFFSALVRVEGHKQCLRVHCFFAVRLVFNHVLVFNCLLAVLFG